jgi:hypothetical protein
MDLEKVRMMVEEIWPGVEITEPDEGVVCWGYKGDLIDMTARFDSVIDVLEVYFGVSTKMVACEPSQDIQARMFPMTEYTSRLKIFEDKVRHWLGNNCGIGWRGFCESPENQTISIEDIVVIREPEGLRNWLEFIDKMVR